MSISHPSQVARTRDGPSDSQSIVQSDPELSRHTTEDGCRVLTPAPTSTSCTRSGMAVSSSLVRTTTEGVASTCWQSRILIRLGISEEVGGVMLYAEAQLSERPTPAAEIAAAA